MNYREIVAEAWEFTQENKKLAMWYGGFPAFFSTGVGIGYIIYQYYSFLASKLFQNWPRSFTVVVLTNALTFLQHNRGWIFPLIITAIIVAIGYFIVPVLCQGALIQMIARRKNGQFVPGKKGLTYGMLSFLPMFEYSLFVQTFSVVSIFSTLAFALRNLGWGILSTVVPLFIFVLIAALAMAIFLTYTQFFIVIDNQGVFASIAKSFSLVVKHGEETLLLTVLMLIISVRILIQLVLVMLIPAVALGIVYLLTLANLPNLGFLLGGVMTFIGLLGAAYLNGIIHTFAMAVWTFTFLKLTSQVEAHARDKTEEEANVDQGSEK